MDRSIDRIKLGSLAVAGFAKAFREVNRSRHPHPKNLKDAHLTIIGIDEPGGDEEQALKKLAYKIANQTVVMTPLPYDNDRNVVFAELGRASIALVLSWHEGFGLAGWEAIAAHVPLILSENTGLWKLLASQLGTLTMQAFVKSLRIRGPEPESPGNAYHHPDDVDDVHDAIVSVAEDIDQYRANSMKLKALLREKLVCTWEHTAATFCDSLPGETGQIVTTRADRIFKDIELPAFPTVREIHRAALDRLLVGTDHPHVFYHWRQRHRALHWVDYYFIRVAARLAKLKLRPRILVTNEIGTAFEAVSNILEPMAGQGALITLDQAQEHRDEYESYARRHVRADVLDRILSRHELDTKTWLLFIPWYCEKNNGKGYIEFLWNNHASKYDDAHAFPMNVVQIPTKSIKMGRPHAKNVKGRNLLIEPPNFPSITEWIASEPPIARIQNFLMHFEPLEASEGLRLEVEYDVRVGQNNLDNALNCALAKNHDEGFALAVNRLARLLHFWNKVHFSSLLEAAQ